MADNTNDPVKGTASTVEHVVGILGGGTIGYTLGAGAAAVAAGLFPPAAPIFLAVTPGLATVIGGWFGHKMTSPN